MMVVLEMMEEEEMEGGEDGRSWVAGVCSLEVVVEGAARWSWCQFW